MSPGGCNTHGMWTPRNTYETTETYLLFMSACPLLDLYCEQPKSNLMGRQTGEKNASRMGMGVGCAAAQACLSASQGNTHAPQAPRSVPAACLFTKSFTVAYSVSILARMGLRQGCRTRWIQELNKPLSSLMMHCLILDWPLPPHCIATTTNATPRKFGKLVSSTAATLKYTQGLNSSHTYEYTAAESVQRQEY